MSWIPLAERFDALPLILAGPLLRRVEPSSVTVWLALKESRKVVLRIYRRDDRGELMQQLAGARRTVRLGDHLHLVAVTAYAAHEEERLAWGGHYYYDLFFLPDDSKLPSDILVPEDAARLSTPGICVANPVEADPIELLIYPGHPLPGFVLPPEDLNQLRIVHGSCRKLHGDGRDTLSALDTLLETARCEGRDGPQQLFLTGDQIYADDVSPVALFALMDAGQFLFIGNEEEVLPLMNVPVRSLAPGSRTDIVRNRAMLTTTHPHNHLLGLHEYAAMYLFAWSNVLWPDALPEAEDVWKVYPDARPGPKDQRKVEKRYQIDQENLADFCSGLSQVRRALANIPTYMICDDHEVTDDWYLDGAWCKQVLTNPPGRRIVRNALLAYALFQAWGNTPEQFNEEQGASLLDALDAWRGEEALDWNNKVELLLGLPKAISGSTQQLPNLEQALSWHYTYTGPRYQVIVMDTRTQRLYRTLDSFPGLLSPDALHFQIASVAHRDAEVTIIVSATPLLGVDLIESLQFWSRWRVRENYAYDREAWSLDWGTFQHLLKTVSELKRVLFLSGDVHYAFGASLQYWDLHMQTTARIIDFTSSPLCNEGSGAQLAILAVGYPRLQWLLHRDGKAGLSFFAWDISSDNSSTLNALVELIHRRIYLFWWAIPRLLAAHRSSDEIVMPAHGWLKGAFHNCPPDRSYQLQYLHNTLVERAPGQRQSLRQYVTRGISGLAGLVLRVVIWLEVRLQHIRERLLRQVPGVEQHVQRISLPARSLLHRTVHETEHAERRLERRRERLVARIFRSVVRQGQWKTGEMIIGSNNLAEINFQWSMERQDVTQRLWWYAGDGEDMLRMTEYHDTLEPPALDTAPPLP